MGSMSSVRIRVASSDWWASRRVVSVILTPMGYDSLPYVCHPGPSEGQKKRGGGRTDLAMAHTVSQEDGRLPHSGFLRGDRHRPRVSVVAAQNDRPSSWPFPTAHRTPSSVAAPFR